MTNGNGKSRWVSIVISVLSFVGGVVVAAYVLGQRTGKVGELAEWKRETSPRIERMDSKGTLSFEKFHEEYLRTQKRQEDHLKDLDKEIHDKQMADLKSRIEALERQP